MAREKGSTLRFLTDPLLGPYQIQLDDYCFISQKITTSETGNEYINVIGHYGTFASALASIAKDELKSQSYESLKDFVTEYDLITKRLENIINV